MIFSNETTVIELLNIPYPSHQHLAKLCGHTYHFLQCEGQGGHLSPIEVDIADLRETLESAVS
jgi:tRNA A37 threonylcarbamoyladenosine dehydratase